ncbi:hypothetical protein [Deinococcus aerophilus]|nr:hypothetical protein [Deinococcus aerophilus]
MSFVRKPRPYSSGLPSVGLPTAAAPVTREKVRPAPRLRRSGPRGGVTWAGAVSALAALGTVLILLVGVSGLWNSVARDWQFRSAAEGVVDAAR